MQPTIISKDKLFITGLTGDANKTGEVWNDFDSRYKENPFPKKITAEGTDEAGYEIRFWSEAKKGQDVVRSDASHLARLCNLHVGFATESELAIDGFDTIVIPATEYAVFEVFVAKGYDSGNAAMDKWVEDNSLQLKCREIDGNGFIIEYYGCKFKDGNQPDSIVEFWVPFYRFCQSCYSPLMKPEDFGKETDGNQNNDYCCSCYENGSLYGGDAMKIEEMIEICVPYTVKAGKYKDDNEARTAMLEFFPKLKRWAK
ncbi:MAG: hypothetical protein FWE82_04300 [Defluviitaleaceae bacterium]|nr:hypothetical protein [Defluviitaleaceae bacterium]